MNQARARILLVDDDQELCELLKKYLSREELEVTCAASGLFALELLESEATDFDLMILDIMMPEMTGIELLQRIRPGNTIPVIMLTGKGDDIDRIFGLEMGADDYLSKPCNPRELLARIRAVLRRVQIEKDGTDGHQSLQRDLHGIKLDTGTRSVQIGVQTLALTSAEFNILALLFGSAGAVLSKEVLTEKVLNRKLGAYDRSIDVHISRLRQKLASRGVEDVILSIRGIGYQLVAERLNDG